MTHSYREIWAVKGGGGARNLRRHGRHGCNGRWNKPLTSTDPLAEAYYHVSPYAYCAGNPVSFVDPDGMGINDVNELEGATIVGERKKRYVMDKSWYEWKKNNQREQERTSKISEDYIDIPNLATSTTSSALLDKTLDSKKSKWGKTSKGMAKKAVKATKVAVKGTSGTLGAISVGVALGNVSIAYQNGDISTMVESGLDAIFGGIGFLGGYGRGISIVYSLLKEPFKVLINTSPPNPPYPYYDAYGNPFIVDWTQPLLPR